MHDWYLGADPARLLTLASEWNLKVSGEEWSNPRLLQGRLASTVLEKMYDAKAVLGTSRYWRITGMVDNCVVGRSKARALAKVFFLANAVTEQQHEGPDEQEIGPDWLTIAETDDIDEAYEWAIKKKEQAPWDLGYVQVAGETESQVHRQRDVPAPNEESVLQDDDI